MSIQVYSGVAIPKSAPRGITPIYPTASLEVGQAFFVAPKEGEDIAKAVKRMSGTTQRTRKENKALKFSVRAASHPETGLPCVGVWRVA